MKDDCRSKEMIQNQELDDLGRNKAEQDSTRLCEGTSFTAGPGQITANKQGFDYICN